MIVVDKCKQASHHSRASQATIAERLKRRQGHYFKVLSPKFSSWVLLSKYTSLCFKESLLSSQFEALEEPVVDDGEQGLVVIDCEAEEEEVFTRVVQQYNCLVMIRGQ